ncbi:MAG: PQQ-dependent sugar dehydrogenase [Fimbriimonas sp.]
MTKWPTLGIAAAIVTLSCSFAMKESSGSESAAPATSAPAPAQGGRAVNITKLYIDTCGKCHGDAGQGGGGGTKTLLTKDLFDQKHDKPFFDAIKNGVPQAGMDAYGATQSDEEIWALVVHIRELQGRALRQQFGSPKPNDLGVFASKYHNFKVETVVDQGKGLATPWSIDWLPDGRMLVTNRPGSLLVVKDGNVLAKVEGLPASVEQGQGGLMEVAVHPRNGFIYLSVADPAKPGASGAMTKIVRGKIKFEGAKATWTNQETIFELDQAFYNGSGVHFGGKIAFNKSGHVFFSIGERGSAEFAQDPTRPNGKIYRVNEDGSIPSDNPFASAADKAQKRIGAIWSMGHRNPQGLTFTPDGKLYDTEHGPRGGDEVNLIAKGANYGWPTAAFSINYNDSPLSTPWPKPGQNITLPLFRWLPSIGASGLDVARGSAFPKWNGDLIAGGLAGNNIDRIRVANGALVEREELLQGMGRVRDLATAPDGSIYVALNQPDKIIRLVPAK